MFFLHLFLIYIQEEGNVCIYIDLHYLDNSNSNHIYLFIQLTRKIYKLCLIYILWYTIFLSHQFSLIVHLMLVHLILFLLLHSLLVVFFGQRKDRFIMFCPLLNHENICIFCLFDIILAWSKDTLHLRDLHLHLNLPCTSGCWHLYTEN